MYLWCTEYSATHGTRKLPRVCQYPAKRTLFCVNQGGTADKKFIRP